MRKKGFVDLENEKNGKIALIWFPNNKEVPTKREQQPLYLRKKLARLSLMDRQILQLKDNGFLEIVFISNEEDFLESIKNELMKKQWSENGFKFDFFNPKELVNYIDEREKYNSTDLILNLSGEWLYDKRIIKYLSENMLNDKQSKEERGKEIVFIQEDREEILKRKQQHLIFNEFLPIIGMLKGKNTIFKQLEEEKGKNELINLFEKLIAISLEEPQKRIQISEIPTYITSMRRELPIRYSVVRGRKELSKAKWLLVKQTQKGTLDFIAWYFNRPLENLTVYLIANGPLTPNQITFIVNILAFIVAGCFIASPYIVTSHLMLARALPWLAFIGLVGVNILDGVDGKLARIRDRLTLLGHLEHSFDQLYEQTVYFAVMWYCLNITEQKLIPWIVLIIAFLIIDTFNRHVSMQYYNVMRVSLADSGRLDRMFRRIDGRRNTYTIHFLIFLLIPWKQYLIISMLIHATITSIIYTSRAIYHLRRADKGIFPKTEEVFET
jgi:phosphatidylglycerophosphate synthase